MFHETVPTTQVAYEGCNVQLPCFQRGLPYWIANSQGSQGSPGSQGSDSLRIMEHTIKLVFQLQAVQLDSKVCSFWAFRLLQRKVSLQTVHMARVSKSVAPLLGMAVWAAAGPNQVSKYLSGDPTLCIHPQTVHSFCLRTKPVWRGYRKFQTWKHPAIQISFHLSPSLFVYLPSTLLTCLPPCLPSPFFFHLLGSPVNKRTRLFLS